MKNFKKVVRIGIIERIGSLYCKIEYINGKLSITGVESPLSNGDARGSCGQVILHEWDFSKFNNGWDLALVNKFRAIWNKWHLNDMKAGSKVQEDYLEATPIPEEDYKYPKSYYDVASEVLANAGLNPDSDGYKYGSAWKKQEVPEDVLEFLKGLPDTDQKPAWV